MLEQLRGRNLAHVGCTIGLLLGLVLGMLVAILVITLYQANADAAVNWATVAFFALTFGLGALGYYLGSRLTQRLWGNSEPDD